MAIYLFIYLFIAGGTAYQDQAHGKEEGGVGVVLWGFNSSQTTTYCL